MPLKRMTENSRIAADKERYLSAKASPSHRAARARMVALSRLERVADDEEALTFPTGLTAAGISSPQPPQD